MTYTKQSTFNRVVKHLRGMEEPSMSSARVCAYRGADGSACAVGALIPDRLYHPLMEGLSVRHNSSILRLVELLGHDVELCADLQDVHDDLDRFFDREFYLACVAQKHGLRMPDLEEP